jgi:hypothetical protein
MVDQEVIGSQLKRDRFPFRSEGDITLAVRNANYTPETADVAHRHEAWRLFWHISTEARPRHCMLWRATLPTRPVPGRHFVALQGRQGTRPARH